MADEAGDFFVEEAEGFGVAGTGVFFAEKADFFGKDKSFPQAFKADAGGSGVNQVAVARKRASCKGFAVQLLYAQRRVPLKPAARL